MERMFYQRFETQNEQVESKINYSGINLSMQLTFKES